MIFHETANNAFTTLAGAVAVEDTEIVVNASSLDDIATPFYVDITTEILEVTDVQADTPEAGETTLTVVRGVGGEPGAYAENVPVLQRVYAQQTNEIITALYLVEQALALYTGGADGVITNSDKGSLEVTADTGMTVSVAAGAAYVSGKMVGSHEAQSVLIVKPESGTRTDLIQISSANVISIKQGSTTPDANNIGLATVELADDMTEVLEGDIDDARVFL